MVEEDFRNEISQVSGSRAKIKYYAIGGLSLLAVVVVFTVFSGSLDGSTRSSDADKSAYTVALVDSNPNSDSSFNGGLDNPTLSQLKPDVNTGSSKREKASKATADQPELMSPEEQKSLSSRMGSESFVVYNAAEMAKMSSMAAGQRVNPASTVGLSKEDQLKQTIANALQGGANDRFSAASFQSTVDVTDASQLLDLEYTILQGKHINAILETPINSNLPGQIKAIVSHDVYGEKSNIVLVPKGSRLIGTYNSATEQGQVRVYVIWTRIITPAHVNIMVNSGGADDLGLSGLAGHVNNHFFKRFGSAMLMSLIGGSIQAMGVASTDQANSGATLREGMGQQFNQMAGQELSKSMNIPPTISLPQGAQVTVMVQRDLKFTNVKSAYRGGRPAAATELQSH